MDQRRAFMGAIAEVPDDDTPRLVFADWLQDEGDAGRAEFIRTQCALARIEGDDRKRPDLSRREDELIAAHKDEWIAQDVPAWPRPGAAFRRGFVAHVAGHVRTFAARGGALFARTPVVSIKAARAHPEDVERLAAVPHLGRLQRLHLYDPYAESFERLLAAPFLPTLRELCLSAWSRSLDVDDAAALLESPLPARLTHLDLDSFRLDVAGMRRLARSEVGGRLEYLHLEVLRDDYLRALAAEGRLGSLRMLDVSGAVLLTDEALRVVAESATFARLSRLDFRALHNLTDDGVRALASSAQLGRLVDVVLSGNRVTDDGIKALVESPNLPRLSRIEVSGTGVSDRWPFWTPLADPNTRVLWVRDVRG